MARIRRTWSETAASSSSSSRLVLLREVKRERAPGRRRRVEVLEQEARRLARELVDRQPARAPLWRAGRRGLCEVGRRLGPECAGLGGRRRGELELLGGEPGRGGQGRGRVGPGHEAACARGGRGRGRLLPAGRVVGHPCEGWVVLGRWGRGQGELVAGGRTGEGTARHRDGAARWPTINRASAATCTAETIRPSAHRLASMAAR